MINMPGKIKSGKQLRDWQIESEKRRKNFNKLARRQAEEHRTWITNFKTEWKKTSKRIKDKQERKALQDKLVKRDEFNRKLYKKKRYGFINE